MDNIICQEGIFYAPMSWNVPREEAERQERLRIAIEQAMERYYGNEQSNSFSTFEPCCLEIPLDKIK